MATEFNRPIDRVFQFGPYELAEREGELRKNGIRHQPAGAAVPGITRTGRKFG